MSRKEDEYLIERMGKLLAEIAVIVNGLPPSNISWSYHDLPEKVRALKQAPPAAVPAGWGLFVDGRLSGHYESEYEARRAANEVGCEVRQLLAANKENNNG